MATETNAPTTMGLMFEPGKIMPGQHPQLRVDGEVLEYQIDRVAHRHPDGSMSRAAATFYAPAIDTSVRVSVVPVEGESPTGSVHLDGLESHKYVAEFQQNGVTYSASLNDAIAAGSYRTTRDGPVARRIVAWANAGEHPEVWVRFYATVFSDGTTNVLVQWINGTVADGVQQTGVEELRVYRGDELIWSFANAEGWRHGYSDGDERTGPWTMNHHSVSTATDPDGEPLWSIPKPTIEKRFAPGSENYQVKARAWFRYRDVDTLAYTHDMEIPAQPIARRWRNTSANTMGMPQISGTGDDQTWVFVTGGYQSHVGSGGDYATTAPLPTWTVKAIAGQTRHWNRIDRILSFVYYDLPWTVLHKENNLLPVLTRHDYDGLVDNQNWAFWQHTLQTISCASFNPGFWDQDDSRMISRWTSSSATSAAGGSHATQPSYWRAMIDGDEWFDDQTLALANHHVGFSSLPDDVWSITGNRARSVSGVDGEVLHGLVHRDQIRSHGNNVRNIECAYWVCPDDDPHIEYIKDIRHANKEFREHQVQMLHQPGQELESYSHLGLIKQRSQNTSLRHQSQEVGLASVAYTFVHWHDGGMPWTWEHFIRGHIVNKGLSVCKGLVGQTGWMSTVEDGSTTGEGVESWTQARIARDPDRYFFLSGDEKCADGVYHGPSDGWNEDIASNRQHLAFNNTRFFTSALAAAMQVSEDMGDLDTYSDAEETFEYQRQQDVVHSEHGHPMGFDAKSLSLDPKLFIRPTGKGDL